MIPTVSPLARGWVATIAGQPCRVLGLASPDRWKQRSATYPGIAAAMAAQWGGAPFAALPLFARCG